MKAKQVFKYCASEELIPHTVYDRLRLVDSKAVEGARKTAPIEPVDHKTIAATVAECSATVKAMIQFERYTGCRPDEVCRLRPCDIQDQAGEVWICQLLDHKTEHHGKQRFIAIGPKAQEVLLSLGPWVPGMNYFVNQRGKPFNTDTYRRAIHRACDKAKIARWSPNRLRHSAAGVTGALMQARDYLQVFMRAVFLEYLRKLTSHFPGRTLSGYNLK